MLPTQVQRSNGHSISNRRQDNEDEDQRLHLGKQSYRAPAGHDVYDIARDVARLLGRSPSDCADLKDAIVHANPGVFDGKGGFQKCSSPPIQIPDARELAQHRLESGTSRQITQPIKTINYHLHLAIDNVPSMPQYVMVQRAGKACHH